MLELFLRLVVWTGLLLVSTVVVFILWHRRKFPITKERTIAFFHPYCSSGGGGERVLWAILQVLGEIDQQGLPINVLIYTVDPPSETYRKGALCYAASKKEKIKS